MGRKEKKLEEKERMGGGVWDEDDMPWNKPIQARPLFSFDLLVKADLTFLCHIFTPREIVFSPCMCADNLGWTCCQSWCFVVRCLTCGSLSINGCSFRII